MNMSRWAALLMLGMTSSVFGDWTPPARPEPLAILKEAKADATAGRYGDALAKHLWLHKNALGHDGSFYGVRLSVALGHWADLAKRYPPALKALNAVREDAARRIRAGSGDRDDFHDFSAISEYLDDEAATAALFVWLDQNNSRLARAAYGYAERALIGSRRYQLCGKYIDSSRSTERMVILYREHQRMAERQRFGAEMRDFSQKSLSNSASTLVALLVLNERGREADAVMAKVLEEWPDEGFRKELQKARTGVVPPPWPQRDS